MKMADDVGEVFDALLSRSAVELVREFPLF